MNGESNVIPRRASQRHHAAHGDGRAGRARGRAAGLRLRLEHAVEVFGADKVVRFLLGVLAKNPEIEVIEQETPDGLGFALWQEGRIFGVVNLEVIGGLVSNIRMVLNPDKLTLWN